MTDYSDGAFMTPYEAMRVLRVNRKTLARWADKGELQYIRTLGGHRRYATRDILRLATVNGHPRPQPESLQPPL
jgi:excisionase family DNA binding protein